MGDLAPFIANIYGVNDLGQGGLLASNTGLSGVRPTYNQAQESFSADLAQRTGDIVDPKTGQLRWQPRTQAEYAAAQSQLEKWAQQQQTGNYDQAMKMLTGSFGGAPGGLGGGAPGTGGLADYYVPGMEDYFGGGHVGTGTTAGGFAVNKNLHDLFTSRLGNTLQNPGLSDQTVNRLIGRGNDVLAQGENSAALELQDKVGAAGGGGGAVAGGLQNLYEQYAAQKAGNARDVSTAAEQDRENRIQQALGTAGDYLSHVQDRMSAMQLRQLEMARQDRNQMMEMMLNRQYSIPNLTGGGPNTNFSFGPGGGGNQGPGQGGMTGPGGLGGIGQVMTRGGGAPPPPDQGAPAPPAAQPPAGGGAPPPAQPPAPHRPPDQVPEGRPTPPPPAEPDNETFGAFTATPYTTSTPYGTRGQGATGWGYAPTMVTGPQMLSGGGAGGGGGSGLSSYSPTGSYGGDTRSPASRRPGAAIGLMGRQGYSRPGGAGLASYTNAA